MNRSLAEEAAWEAEREALVFKVLKGSPSPPPSGAQGRKEEGQAAP